MPAPATLLRRLFGALGRAAAARRGGTQLSGGAGEQSRALSQDSERGEPVDVLLHVAGAPPGGGSLWAIPPSRLPFDASGSKSEQEDAAPDARCAALDIEDESDVIEQKKWTQQALEAAEQERVDEG